jgi:hypothetical protein
MLALLLTLSTGCEDETDAESAERAFAFETVETVPLQLHATVRGRPLDAALVTVRRVPERGGGVLAVLKTDERGRGTAVLSLEPDESSVQVMVTRAGVRGAFDDEAAARQHGLFAPAAQKIYPVTSLRSLELAFEEVEQ